MRSTGISKQYGWQLGPFTVRPIRSVVIFCGIIGAATWISVYPEIPYDFRPRATASRCCVVRRRRRKVDAHLGQNFRLALETPFAKQREHVLLARLTECQPVQCQVAL